MAIKALWSHEADEMKLIKNKETQQKEQSVSGGWIAYLLS